jgi:nucleotide-binding universal stress UspA family protein
VYTHILISTDGSELAQHGVDHGLSLAKALGSKVTIVTATEPFPPATAGAMGGWVPAPVDYEGYGAGQQELAEKILSAAKAAAEKMGIEADTVHVPDTWPAVAIVDTAQQRNCNLIVMASHGRRGLAKVLLGSQTSEVLVTATVPVLVVR